MNSSVKIFILNWNGGEALIECLESVIDIEYDNFKVVVIDNASTDKSIDSIHNQFPEVEVIALNENYGYAKAHNKAFELTGYKQDDFFLLLNNDTIVDKFIIANLIKSAESVKIENNKYILGAKIYYLNKSKSISYSNNNTGIRKNNYEKTDRIWYNGGKVNLEYGIIEHIKRDERMELPEGPKFINHYITGCCMFAPVEVFEELDGFDDRFFMYCEDVDFSLRAAKKNIWLGMCHQSVLWHRVSYSLGNEFSYRKIISKLSSLVKLYNKHVKWHIRYFSFCLLLLRMLISGIRSRF